MMSTLAVPDLDRSLRLAIGRAATLRDGSKTPVDVVVEDISRSGCLIRAEVELTPGEAVSIGIPGLGMCHGTVSRANHPHYGCAFSRLISTDDIPHEGADTIVVGHFAARSHPASVQAQDADPDVRKFPLRVRFALIVGTSVALWVPLLMIARRLIV